MNSIEYPEMNYKHFREKNAKFHIFVLLSIMGGISLITIYDRKFRHNRSEEGLPKMITYISPINMVAEDNHLYFAYKSPLGTFSLCHLNTRYLGGLSLLFVLSPVTIKNNCYRKKLKLKILITSWYPYPSPPPPPPYTNSPPPPTDPVIAVLRRSRQAKTAPVHAFPAPPAPRFCPCLLQVLVTTTAVGALGKGAHLLPPKFFFFFFEGLYFQENFI